MRNVTTTSNLSSILSQASAPPASLKTQSHLFGDVNWEEAGDVADFGDVDPLAAYATLMTGDVGDAADYGDLRSMLRSPIMKKLIPGAMGFAAGRLMRNPLQNILNNVTAQSNRVKQMMRRNTALNTVKNQLAARKLLGRIGMNQGVAFFSIEGGAINASPLAVGSTFVSEVFRWNLNKQSNETPYESEIKTASLVGADWVATTTAGGTGRYYTGVFVLVGINTLAANPGTVFTLTGTLPTINGGSTVISANPLSFTISKDFYARILIFPWTLVTNVPYNVIGYYTAASPITVTVSGLPAQAQVTLLVPGSQHPWTIAMRNSFISPVAH